MKRWIHIIMTLIGMLVLNQMSYAQSGCTLPTACNYDPSAIENDGSCSWTVDCAGNCGGTFILDDCGNCYDPAGQGPAEVFDYTGSMQYWTVPDGVTEITIEAYGAQGGSCGFEGGRGAHIQSTVSVTPGEQLTILVGGQGSSACNASGGGGGSFIANSLNEPLVVAGGGSGATQNSAGKPGLTTENGGDGDNCAGTGGTGGNGGDDSANCNQGAGGGGGFYTNGQSDSSYGYQFGYGFLQGGAGGTSATGDAFGGFGGGAGTHSNNTGGGAGGGYSGGGASYHGNGYSGGGGGSFAAGAMLIAEEGVQTGNGQVLITYSTVPDCAPGCTDPTADNYDPSANFEDGSCSYDLGCIDASACNYDPIAIIDDGSCAYDFDCAGNCGGNAFINPCGDCEDPDAVADVVDFTYTGSMQYWTVPDGVTEITIEAYGAQGGSCGFEGGRGAHIQSTVSVTPGEQLTILVGGQGSSACNASGGGGGSFIANSLNEPLVVAGGGSGATGGSAGKPGLTTENGGDGDNCAGTGGTGGNGGDDSANCNQGAGGGGGFYTNGQSDSSYGYQFGYGFLQGGAGGTSATGDAFGGFGGGAGTHSNNTGGGAGGGYSGGGASYHGNGYSGGGGGSFAAGAMLIAEEGVQTGNGQVTISYGEGLVAPCIGGCMIPEAYNYNPEADYDDGSCTILDCNDVYTGDVVVDFQRLDYSDWNDPSNRDLITPSCEITRQNSQGIFNYALEGFHNQNSSPANTEWKWGDYNSPNPYTYWRDAVCGYSPYGCPNSAFDYPNVMTMHILDSDLYFEVSFTQWTCCGAGGGFAYTRTFLAAESGCNEVLAVTGCMDASACNYDPLANLDDGSCIYGGCTDPLACNYDPNAPCDNGSCSYTVDCAGVCGGSFVLDDCGNCYDPAAQGPAEVFDYTGSMQYWTVPDGVTEITIEAYGAQGGSCGFEGGRGAHIQSTVSVTPGEQLTILVGGQGSSACNASGGGGGSFIANSLNEPLVVAGGGSGATGGSAGKPGLTTENGGDGDNCAGTGGTGGNGGDDSANCNQGAGGGGGFYTNGQSDSSYGYQFGYGFLQGGAGGTSATGDAFGGFGGGAGTHSNNTGGGAGGGYSGGGASYHGNGYSGGGGGSFAAGAMLIAEEGVQTGNGQVLITYSTVPDCAPGCTDPTADNYDPSANFEDGSCVYDTGCTDATACNYDPTALNDDGSCAYDFDCAGNCGGNAFINPCGDCEDPDAVADVVDFTYTGSMQTWTVPDGVTSITIETWGAEGGSNSYCTQYPGGLGAHLRGTFDVVPGQMLNIVVGQKGLDNAAGNAANYASSGGGGTFVWIDGEMLPLIVAGGGGGGAICESGGNPVDAPGMDAVITEEGTYDRTNVGAGGVAGNDGSNQGAGKGWLTVMNNPNGDTSAIPNGGYGGGGAESGDHSGGGGGGYSGGGARPYNGGFGSPAGGGGGGGSYNAGVDQFNEGGVHSGDGLVTISYGEGLITPCIGGCMIPEAYNYNPAAVYDDGSCTILDCNDVYTGDVVVDFQRLDYSDWNDPSNRDLITPSCEITRQNSQGIFNYALEGFHNQASSPANTEWKWGDYNSPNPYMNWRDAVCGYSPYGCPNSAFDYPNVMTMHILDSDLYFEVSFTQWTCCGAGGGFAYTRTFLAAESGCNEVLAVTGCMDASACNYDPLANLDDGSCIYGGCTDPLACNYDPNAPCDNGSCSYTVDCAGVCGGSFVLDDCGNCYDPAAQGPAEVFDYTGSLQYYTVPDGVTEVTIEAFGAQGGNGNGGTGGLGAQVRGTVSVVPGEVLTILVGGEGQDDPTRPGGGGGSFIVRSDNSPLVIAGGGGGVINSANGNEHGQISESGLDGYSPCCPSNYGIGGTNGNGATNSPSGPCAGNGGGFYTDGAEPPCAGGNVRGKGFLNGGQGGVGSCGGQLGGYGGGGGGGCDGAGGGGGYSGGGASYADGGYGGGGGSFNAGVDAFALAGVQTGNGQVLITYSTVPDCAPGCTDPTADNYDPSANFEDGSCVYDTGCTDATACNYDPTALNDDGSCAYDFDCAGNCGGNAFINPCGDCEDPDAVADVVDFTYTGSMQYWTVPDGVTEITIEAYGAQGGSCGFEGGRGAHIQSTVSVTPGEQLTILVGGQGSSACNASGGGGGSFIANSLNEPLVVAGGGSGATGGSAGKPGLTTENGGDGDNCAGTGGTGGNGGDDSANCNQGAGGGGGFYTNGQSDSSYGYQFGYGFLQGGAGGTSATGDAFGGFGGGAGTHSNNTGGGAGGGYSGGGASYHGNGYSGGGGGSFAAGAMLIAEEGVQTGNGQVTISYGEGLVAPCIGGCMIPEAYNYNPEADYDDGSCTILDCNDVYTGDVVVDFQRLDYSDWNDPSNRDLITPSCEITRQNSQGIFNYALEGFHNQNSSPANTEWKWGDYNSPNPYTYWRDAVCGYSPYGCPNSAFDYPNVMTMHILDSDLYFEVSFTQWTCCGAGGGFAYTRTFLAAESGCNEVLAVTGCMDASACNYDPLANLDDGSCIYGGCTDPLACNYDPNAPCDNGSCSYTVDCAGVCGGSFVLDDCGNCYDPAAQGPAEVFDYTGSMQYWTVPDGVTEITIEAYGAQGGSCGFEGGRGAHIQSTVSVTPGEQLTILVGGQGSSACNASGGGGGSFIANSLNEPLVVAGGGSGATGGSAGKPGLTTENGGDGDNCAGTGGTGGNGGDDSANCNQGAGGGGGFYTNGQSDSSYGYQFGYGFLQGGAGGTSATGDAFGGFGGGAGTHSNNTGGGAGGGYSGGGASYHGNGYSGGGGGSFAAGAMLIAEEGVQTGNGQVLITYSTVPDCAPGCTDPTADNYDPSANFEDGSCVYDTGCTDATACNYDPTALNDDGSCAYDFDCAGNCGGNAFINPCGDCEDPDAVADVVDFTYTGSMQTWTVPDGVTSITIETWGAEGGSNSYCTQYPGGLGAHLRGTFDVVPGQMLNIVVGQKGLDNAAGNAANYASSGGGGTFVWIDGEMLPLIVAGGGGGGAICESGGNPVDAPGMDAVITEEGTYDRTNVGAGGVAGNDGSNQGAGKGWLTVMNNPNGDTSAIPNGGYGGGGAESGDHSGGGGGGYSGGGARPYNGGFGSPAGGGGGGGSYNAGVDQFNEGGVHSGDGLVTISYGEGLITPCIGGCMIPEAYNYNPEADYDDGSCTILDCNDVYTGDVVVDFQRLDYSDWNDPSNRDLITPSCEITRQNSQGIFNYALEGFHNQASSPANTEWKWGDYNSPNPYMNWRDAVCGYSPYGCPNSAFDYPNVMTMHILDSDLYFEVSFTQWTCCGAGGGFAYTRTFLAAESGCNEVLAVTGCMDASACNYDPLANLDDGSCAELDECGVCGGTGTLGCIDATACNYNPQADCDDGTCIYYVDCNGVCGGTSIVDDCGNCYDPMGAGQSITFNYAGPVIQSYIIPQGASMIRVDAYGAQGGSLMGDNGGLGAQISGTFEVSGGDVLSILVGGAGSNSDGILLSAGGGGGSFVVDANNSPLVVAGGGGAVLGEPTNGSEHASGTETGNNGYSPISPLNYGVGGSAGSGASNVANGTACGGNGGGFFTNGEEPLCAVVGSNTSGWAFLNGGIPGTSACGAGISGGYGGGGGGGCDGAGGGGGYSGGGGNYGPSGNAGGGGSFNAGVDPVNIGASNAGDGYVIITVLPIPECTLGCTDPVANNYNPDATDDDGSCLYSGCTDPTADNYNPNANEDDGSCVYSGCTYADASNYNPIATIDDGSCIFEDCPAVSGCTDPLACNYNPSAEIDDGSCLAAGCTYPLACNYDATALCDDGSCILPDGCTDATACNFDPAATCDNGMCDYSCQGCMEPTACNYDVTATIEDGSCEFVSCLGCTDANANNYDPTATVDDGSCQTWSCMYEGPVSVTFTKENYADWTLAENQDQITNTVWIARQDNQGIYNAFDQPSWPGNAVGGPSNTEWKLGGTADAGVYTSWIVAVESNPNVNCNNDNLMSLHIIDEDLYFDVVWHSFTGGNNGGGFSYTRTLNEALSGCVAEPIIYGCTDATACNYDPLSTMDDGSCEFSCYGCTSITACNYSINATIDDGSCDYSCAGCTYLDAMNYDPVALIDDGSCTFDSTPECQGDINEDGIINSADLLFFLSVFGTSCGE